MFGVSGEELTSIEDWLTCEECLQGERDSVRAIGGRSAKPLKNLMVEYPPGWRQNVQWEEEERAERLGLPGGQAAEFVGKYLGNFVAATQRRAIVSLVDVRAEDALREIAESPAPRDYRQDVADDLVFAINHLGGGLWNGRIYGSLLGSGDVAVSGAEVGMTRCVRARVPSSPPHSGRCLEYQPDTSMTVTDAQGEYEFTGITEGVFEVWVESNPPGRPVAPAAVLVLLTGRKGITLWSGTQIFGWRPEAKVGFRLIY